jgi:hypothetical protein
MLPTSRFRAGLFTALIVAAVVPPVSAQISKADLSMVRPPAGRNSTAFDPWNKVYLVVEAGSPLTGRFLGENGSPVTGVFPITSGSEAGYTGWASITFGGSQSDPTFLVTYVAAEGGGAHTKYSRLVRFAGGAPTVTGRSAITGVGPEWYAAEKAQSVWFGGQFIVGTRAPGGFIAQALVHHVDLNNTVTGGISLGDGQDYYGSPAIACASNGVCLATGYAGGIPLGNPNANATFARLFNAQTLQPISGIVYLDGLNGRLEEQMVTYNSKTGRFLSGWWRAGTVQTRLIGTDGCLDVARTALPDFAGDLAIAFNTSTQTTLLVTKRAPADLYVLELGDDGMPVNVNNMLLVTRWDGAWPEYTPAVTPNHAKGQWLVTAIQTSGGRGILVTGNGAGGGTSCAYSLSSSSQTFGAFGGVGGFTLTTTTGCAWQATSNSGWLTPSAGSVSGTGSQTISYNVANNSSSTPRTSSITVGGQVFTVTQAGVTLDPFTLRELGRSDFNRDGFYDLLWQNTSTGQLAAWMLNGGSVKVETGLGLNMPDTNWQIAGTGDFNGDGKPDILWRNRVFGYVAVWLMYGVTPYAVYSLSIPQVADTAWKIAGVGDFNLDGRPDIIWQHDSGPVVIWAMDGLRVAYGTPISGDPAMTADPHWRVAGVADMNFDGYMDLVWRHDSGWLGTWLMIRTNVWQVQPLNPVAEFDTSWRIVALIDANRDGRYDIVWQRTDGTVVLWAMDGLNLAYAAGITGGSLGGPSWKVVGPK